MSSLSGTANDEGVLRSRMLPAEYGKWYSVRRFARWSEQGVWEKMHCTSPKYGASSTTVRAHPYKKGDSSRRLFSTKVHVSVDALGRDSRSLRVRHTTTQADELIDGIESDLIATGYDSQRLRERIVEMGATPVIQQTAPLQYDEPVRRASPG